MRELDYGKMGNRIRQVRKAKGWSQDELAKKCGISMSFLGHIERGTKIMSLETFVHICNVLGASADGLLWGFIHLPDIKMDLRSMPVQRPEQAEEQETEQKQAYKDSYSMYIKIIKSVAEIMNEE